MKLEKVVQGIKWHKVSNNFFPGTNRQRFLIGELPGGEKFVRNMFGQTKQVVPFDFSWEPTQMNVEENNSRETLEQSSTDGHLHGIPADVVANTLIQELKSNENTDLY